MASPTTDLTNRPAPAVMQNPNAPLRSRLPAQLKLPLLVLLNFCINAGLWEGATNFLDPELGAVSKVPGADELSLYSPYARLAMRIATIWLTWFFKYDALDVTALTVLMQVPYVYLLNTYYGISLFTMGAFVNIEVISMALPTFLLRAPSPAHRSNVSLRNRFLLNSIQVQVSNAALALAVYWVLLYANLKTDFLNVFLVRYFEVRTLDAAHSEDAASIVGKTFIAAFAAREFLLNPSIAAEPASGSDTPIEPFNAATATLPQTIKHNFWRFDRRVRCLIQQTAILNMFVFLNTVQRVMTLVGTEFTGAAGYAMVWVLANSTIAAWYSWSGDTSMEYEPM